MEEARDDARSSGQGSSRATWWPSELAEKLESVSFGSREESLSKETPRNIEQDGSPSRRPSQVLWDTGMLSEPIPNGFYAVTPDKRLKDLFDGVPSLDELHALGEEGFKAEVILVDFQKDKKLTMLKQLTATLIKGLNSNPAAMIKKIARLVSDVYKQPTLESPSKAALEENSLIKMLGQIKHGSCRPRAILFKVLADSVGLESRLTVGFPNDGTMDCMDSYKHMSVIVLLNSVELLVDLMRFPGQLIPRSAKTIYMTHISAAGESDSAENDSCDSPLEPNSPLYGFSDRTDLDSLSHSEPNIATAFWRRSRRRAIAEQRTASSSPEHPSFHSHGRSKLSGSRNLHRDQTNDASPSSYRSDGASTSASHRTKRRSTSVTPEIGDDIVRAVRAMNEALKQNRSLQGRGDENRPDFQKNGSNFNLDDHNQISAGSAFYSHSKDEFNPHKAMSLPSSTHGYRSQTFERSGPSDFAVKDTWNKVLESLMFQDKPLLPYQEWDIDFSELAVGTRVGIGFFGEVFRGTWNGTDVAIKVFLEQDLTAENMQEFCNEISILSRLRHPNVILFLGACTRPPRLSMVTEYMDMGSLYYLIHMSGQKKKLSWRKRLKMLRDICRGLMCLHRMKIVHRDIKSANCLVNKHWTVKICDFGLSRIMTDATMKDTSSAGTPEWMAPELIRNEPFTEKCDIFSLGVIMWELCALSRPWEGVPPERVVYAVANEGSRLGIPEGPLGKLIADCWAEPQERPSCEEILSRLLDCEYSLC